jgi:hypothetical protein
MVTVGLPSEFRPVSKTFEEAEDGPWTELDIVELSLSGWQTIRMTQKGYLIKMCPRLGVGPFFSAEGVTSRVETDNCFTNGNYLPAMKQKNWGCIVFIARRRGELFGQSFEMGRLSARHARTVA